MDEPITPSSPAESPPQELAAAHLQLDYARQGTYQRPRKTLAKVGEFLEGMLLPLLVLAFGLATLGRVRAFVPIMYLLELAVPIALLCFTRTRFLGLGWLAMVSGVFLTVFTLCR